MCYDRTVSLLRVSGYFRQRNLVVDNLLDKGKSYLKKQTGRDLDDFKDM
ncbi:hypothetical protein QG37_06723 [Candidozyma auris]|nr:hypothetical protein QG37_06723 [[Candida] auris]